MLNNMKVTKEWIWCNVEHYPALKITELHQKFYIVSSEKLTFMVCSIGVIHYHLFAKQTYAVYCKLMQELQLKEFIFGK